MLNYTIKEQFEDNKFTFRIETDPASSGSGFYLNSGKYLTGGHSYASTGSTRYDEDIRRLYIDVPAGTVGKVSFVYQIDTDPSDKFRVSNYKTNEVYFSKSGLINTWTTSSFVLPAGSHEIKFEYDRTSGAYGLGIANAVWIDSITLDVTQA